MSEAPIVSVIMANHNGAAHLAEAVRAVLGQTLTSLELILSDDASTDDSVAVARAAAGGDPRLVVIAAPENGGSAVARNRAFRAARGRWIAIVDSDDVIQRERLARLVRAAETDGADIVADNLLIFYDDDPSRRPHLLLRGALARQPAWIGFEDYVRSNRFNGPGPALGYLKPLIRRTRLAELEGPYNEKVLIIEDYDMVQRLLARGARMRVYPEPGYLYRKHAASVSHRLNPRALQTMLDADGAFRRHRWLEPPARKVLDERRSSIVTAIAYERLLAALKARRFLAALRIVLNRPAAGLLLRQALAARLRRLLPRRAAGPAKSAKPRIVVLSRQRITGATSGSSAYLLSLAGAIREAGYSLTYLGVSPTVFGRMPVLRLKAEARIFDDYRVHGGVRIGNLVFATDPRIAAHAALTALEAVLAKLRIRPAGWVRSAAYSVAAAATPQDALFIARHSGPQAAAGVLCDYAFLAPLAPYALAFKAPVLLLMHDLFSSRTAQFASLGERDSVARLDVDEEFRLLSCADAVIAIQQAEADEVRRRLPATRVLVAPMAVKVGAPQPGRDDELVFVGSNTAPNTVAMKWFMAEVWPRIRAARPNARLSIAGSVARSLPAPPAGVRLLGVVGSLDPLYASAGVVVAPLLTGSGLKIKLVEALGAGKAVVATGVALQGVERIARDAVLAADDPQGFAEAVLALLDSPGRREELGRRAIECARTHFGPQACYAPVVEALRHGVQPQDRWAGAPMAAQDRAGDARAAVS